MKFIFIFTFLFILQLSLFSAKIILKTAAQDSPPKYFKRNNKMQGICVDIIKEIEKVDKNIKIVGYENFLPFKRIQLYLKNGVLDIFIGFAKSKIREKLYNFIEIPLYPVYLIYAIRANDNVTDFKNNGKILTVKGTYINKFLQKLNLDINDSALTIENALKMLLYKRGRFVFYHNLGLIYTAKKKNLMKKIKIINKPLTKYYHYVVLSKRVPYSIYKELKEDIIKLRNNEILEKIYKKYTK